MQYRRDYTAGVTYFFTVVVFRRQALFDDPMRIALNRPGFLGGSNI
jgi:REP element-mobilizing transposase RayT